VGGKKNTMKILTVFSSPFNALRNRTNPHLQLPLNPNVRSYTAVNPIS
jgi:hypothetical protein